MQAPAFEAVGQTADMPSGLVASSFPSKLKAVTVSDFDSLAHHIPAWDLLAWDAPQRVPTQLPGWVDAYLRHRLKPDDSWFCSLAYDGDRLVGVLPIIASPHPILGHRWSLLRTPFDAHTRSGDITLAADCASQAFNTLLSDVFKNVPHHLGLSLKAVRRSSPVWLALQGQVSGYIVRHGLRSMYSFLDVQGDLNSYLSGLGKMRQNLRRRRRKLESRGAVSVEMMRGGAASEDFLAEFLALEASGWKGRMGTAILNNPDLVAFYTTLVRNFAAREQLEWHAIRVGDRLIAGQLGVRCGASLILPKYAYDEEFAECSPGQLLTEEVFRRAFSDSELVEVNTMSSAAQHRLWNMPTDEYIDVQLVRRDILPILIHLPGVVAQEVYHNHLRSRIPPAAKKAYQDFKLRRYLKTSQPVRNPSDEN